MKYIAIIPNYWGRGDTIEAAQQQVRKEGGRITKRTKLKVYRVSDDGAYVSGMGAICALKGSECELMLDR